MTSSPPPAPAPSTVARGCTGKQPRKHFNSLATEWQFTLRHLIYFPLVHIRLWPHLDREMPDCSHTFWWDKQAGGFISQLYF